MIVNVINPAVMAAICHIGAATAGLAVVIGLLLVEDTTGQRSYAHRVVRRVRTRLTTVTSPSFAAAILGQSYRQLPESRRRTGRIEEEWMTPDSE